jgi:hypothetical protein
MDPEKTVGYELREVSTRGSEPPGYVHSSATEFTLPQAQAAPNPLQFQQTEKSRFTDFINNGYDAALIAAPMALVSKAGLVIAAHHRDKYKSGSVSDPPSKLTTYLIEFNAQVWTLDSIILHPADFCLARHTIHRHLHDYNSHLGQTVCTLERAERGECCKLRAISSKHQFTGDAQDDFPTTRI